MHRSDSRHSAAGPGDGTLKIVMLSMLEMPSLERDNSDF
jgi:hypothetical protein